MLKTCVCYESPRFPRDSSKKKSQTESLPDGLPPPKTTSVHARSTHRIDHTSQFNQQCKMTIPLKARKVVQTTETAMINGRATPEDFYPQDPSNQPHMFVKPFKGVNMKPTEEEDLALQAIRRLGEEIDNDFAISFLRGSSHIGGDQSATSGVNADRALPSKSVNTLKLWFLAHQHDPYPSKEEKERLMQETGLSLVQLKNWFSNIRKRHWHPIRTGSRRPRSHVEYVLLLGASAKESSTSLVMPSDSSDEGDSEPLRRSGRPLKRHRESLAGDEIGETDSS